MGGGAGLPRGETCCLALGSPFSFAPQSLLMRRSMGKPWVVVTNGASRPLRPTGSSGLRSQIALSPRSLFCCLGGVVLVTQWLSGHLLSRRMGSWFARARSLARAELVVGGVFAQGGEAVAGTALPFAEGCLR